MSEEIKEKPITPVIFRIWKKTKEEEGGDVIALFPTIKEDENYHCLSYMHIGQHGSADYYGIIQATRPCRNGEEVSLKKELESRGYNLKVYQRKPNLPMEL